MVLWDELRDVIDNCRLLPGRAVVPAAASTRVAVGTNPAVVCAATVAVCMVFVQDCLNKSISPGSKMKVV